MKSIKQSVILELQVNLTIEVSGIYTPEEPMVMYYADGSGYPGSPSEFDITDIKIISGSIVDYTDYLSGESDIWEHLTELAIKQIEK